MFKRMLFCILGFILMLHMYGCALLVAGAVGGVGTAVWLSDKLVQDVNAPFERSIKAAKAAFAKLNMSITKETSDDNVSQLISEYYGKKVWVDVHKVSSSASRIEVRVGLTGDEQAAREILNKILLNI